MTLLLTAVVADGIVMGTDSALTISRSESTLALARFPKAMAVDRLGLGLTVAGASHIGDDRQAAWITDWLVQFTNDVTKATNIVEYASELASTLRDTLGPSDESHVFQIAGWVQVANGSFTSPPVPAAFEVANVGAGYQSVPLLQEDFMTALLQRRAGQTTTYPIRFLATGVPRNLTARIDRLAREFSALIGAQVPYGDISAITEFVRFLIRTVSDLYRIARQPGIVSEPIETMVLLPQPTAIFSVRY